jgi:hypothetical protein
LASSTAMNKKFDYTDTRTPPMRALPPKMMKGT